MYIDGASEGEVKRMKSSSSRLRVRADDVSVIDRLDVGVDSTCDHECAGVAAELAIDERAQRRVCQVWQSMSSTLVDAVPPCAFIRECRRAVCAIIL